MSSPRPLIDRYEACATTLAYAASNLSPSQATARPGPGAWSIAELVAHLADSDLVAADRMKRVIAEDAPKLLAYDQDAWVARLSSHAMPPDEALALLVANRRWMARILRGLPEADFARAGEHSEVGRVTLAALVAGQVTHVDHHLLFLYGKRMNLGVALIPRYVRD